MYEQQQASGQANGQPFANCVVQVMGRGEGVASEVLTFVCERCAQKATMRDAGAPSMFESAENGSPSSPTAAPGPSAPTIAAAGLMGPPSAPASLLWSFKASDNAKDAAARQDDPFVCARLVLAIVILFRKGGKASEIKAIGQFTIDLVGEREFYEWLEEYVWEPAMAVDPLRAYHPYRV